MLFQPTPVPDPVSGDTTVDASGILEMVLDYSDVAVGWLIQYYPVWDAVNQVDANTFMQQTPTMLFGTAKATGQAMAKLVDLNIWLL